MFNRPATHEITDSPQAALPRYDLSSTALLLCFLAPLLFLAFAQLAVATNAWEKAGVEASDAAKKHKENDMRTPDDPKKQKDEEKDEGRHSPKPGYALAGVFFAIYRVGRWLEPWLIRRRLRQLLAAA